jgi:hypothetical protein
MLEARIAPSPGSPGEGRGEGLFVSDDTQAYRKPLPSP